ncbi:hypothetical protein GOBAR_AA01256 [Gossypium barbadense]|uniref:DDE Tnp4 domain-containing protein n=1 Tax=Gossypium barbadense TaxID=3634 RepID=A0A2P5YUN8_GOSBA|nr:hypothetical protein GOBAR_AA01256 [Gossypium barbadense]
MLGVCTPDIQFVYVLPGWEGFVADGRVLRDAINRRHGLKVPHGYYSLVDAGYTNCEGFKRQKYHLNEWHQDSYVRFFPIKCFFPKFSRNKRKWVPEEDATLVACMVDLHNARTFNANTGFKAGYLNELEKSKDRATGKDVQTASDIVEEINAEDVAATNTYEERNDFHGSEADVSLDDMDLSATQPQLEPQPARNQAVGLEISKSIASEVVIQQKSEMTIQKSALKLYPTFCEVEGLIEDERYQALSKIPNHPTQMLIFFSLPSAMRLEWVRRFLADH